MSFRCKVRIGHEADGNPIDKYLTAQSREELEVKRQEIIQHYIKGNNKPKNYAFYEYAAEWYSTRKEPFISDSQRASYKVCFMKHLVPQFGLQHMSAITAQQLQEFINTFSGSSKSQITMIVGTIKQIFTTTYAEGVIKRNPSVALVRPKAGSPTERRSLTEEETKNVKETIQTHPDGLFLAVLYYLGLRRGEALGLKWSDFSEDMTKVHVQRDIDFANSTAKEGTLKTKNSDRFVPVPEELRKLLKLGGGYLFPNSHGQPLSENSFRHIWCNLMMACGCVEWKKVKDNITRPEDILRQVKPTLTPHYFRHNYVSMLYESGIDPLMAMKIVGHADYQTTANIYTHLKEESLKKAQVNLEKVFSEEAEE